ncbi:MAG: OmpA family protein [Pseudomonadota bacterium]|nr:OmpA family protein [Pseudomonadota bacterium]
MSQIADAVTQEASTLAGVVENKVTQVVQDAKDIIEPRLDAVVKGAAGIVKKVAATVGGNSAATSNAAAGSFPLGGSVGRGGKNAMPDVAAVQGALGIGADGQCGPQTIAAIEAFQRRIGQARPDGRVDAGGATERAMAGGAAPLGQAAAASAESGSSSLLDRAAQAAQDMGSQAVQAANEMVAAGASAVAGVAAQLSGDDDSGGSVGSSPARGLSASSVVADLNAAGQPIAYEPGERQASSSSPGGVEKTAGGFLLFNFGVNKTFIKPEHQKVLVDLIARLHLDDPNTETSVIKVSGFTDGVDVEPKNSPLRADRADAVQIFLLGKGADEANVGTAISTPAGTFLAPNTTREGRSRNRAVLVELGSVHVDPIPDPVKPKSTKTTKWALQSNLAASPPVKPGVSITTANFILHDRENKKKFLLEFTGFGGGFGVGFFASVSLPSPTEFETTVPRDVDEFNGGGAIRSASVGLGLGFSIGEAQLHVSTVPPQIDIGGFQFSFGADASFVGGQWKVLG